MSVIPNVLTIAGVDPSGGAGVLADVKSISALGGYAMSAITALTVQNTCGVRGVHIPPADFLTQQLQAISDDVRIDAVKIGMLGSVEVIAAVAEWLFKHRPAVVVLDPVMVATSGDPLLTDRAQSELVNLAHVVDVVTPNVPELEILSGQHDVTDQDAVLAAARLVAQKWSVTVVAKGGHLDGDQVVDTLVVPAEDPTSSAQVTQCTVPKVATSNTHGTGCSLSSALATALAFGNEPEVAYQLAKKWLQEALLTADHLDVGRGHGPVNHLGQLWATGKQVLPDELPELVLVSSS